METINHNLSFFRKHIIKLGKQNYSHFPWRITQNKWHALVAEIMLQRTKAEQVIPIYKSFTDKYESPSDYLKDNSPDIFSNLGLKWREGEFKKLSDILSISEIPIDKQSLVKLPGVGEYIASAILSLHAGKREPIIDSNVVRVYGRFFGFETDGETRRKKWFIELADRMTPKRIFKEYNYGLIDFSRQICKPKPRCDLCPLTEKCIYYSSKV